MGILEKFGLEGEVAVIVGGGKGIGRDIAIGLAEAGADVAIAARTQADIDEVAKEVEARGRKAVAIATDCTSMDALENLAQQTVARLGKLTIWINNAGGIPDATPRYLTETGESNFDAQINLNFKAVWMGATVASKYMDTSGGKIINISSRASFGPQAKNGPYGASKAAVNSLTQTLSVELAPNIRVNAIAPGPVPTQNFDECVGVETDEERDKLLAQFGIPLGRYGQGEDIAAAATFLSSQASSWITGQCLFVTGGR